jgi:hypothetical protein
MNNLCSLILYIAVFAISAVLIDLGLKRKNKLQIILGIIITATLSGLRYMVGTDYNGYVSIYNSFAKTSFITYLETIFHQPEIGIYFISRLSKYLCNGPLLVFLLTSFITIIFFVLAIKNLNPKHRGIVFFILLTTILPTSFNTIRQMVAVSIFLYAVNFIFTKKPIKYIFWVIVASLFHISALVLIPLVLIPYIIRPGVFRNRFLFITVITFCTVVTCLAIPFIFEFITKFGIFEKYSIYEGYVGYGDNNTFYLKAALFAIILIFYKYFKQISYINYFVIFAAIDVAISSIGFESAYLKRMALYFSFALPILLTCIIDVFDDVKGQIFTSTVIVLYGFLFFYISYYVLLQANIIPYRSVVGI